jgi:hypothetical protein
VTGPVGVRDGASNRPERQTALRAHRRAGHEVPASLRVERLGRHVEAVVGPDDRAGFDRDLREALWVAQRLEHARPLAIVEADVAHGAVLEGQTEIVRADDLDIGDVNEWG